MKNIDEIKRKILAIKGPIHQKFGVSNIELFGSYICGEQRMDSDLDVQVEFDRDVSLLDVAGLQIFLTDELEIKTDIVLKRSVRKELKDIILSEAIPV
jgi:uncharacterized protein